MRGLYIIGFLFILVGCKKTVSAEDLNLLNGYWEIEKVVFRDGQTKEYKVNTYIDFIKIEDFKGFKKKVQPKFDGSYSTSNDVKAFTIVENKGVFQFSYETELSTWKESIIIISSDNFSVTNAEGIQYNYKRFQPIKVEK